MSDFYMKRHGLKGDVHCLCGTKFTNWTGNKNALFSDRAAITATCSNCGRIGGQSKYINKDKQEEFRGKVDKLIKSLKLL